ncbi:MAG: serine/threonine-protein kinase [Acidimicrobiales bacterium]
MADGDGRIGEATHHSVGDAAELGIEGLAEVTVIGSGGSSTVYRARQPTLDRTVAIKVIHAAWSIETRERFEHEREVMGRLSGHSAIVPIFETGITKRGEPFLLMPFYERGSLFRLMKDHGPMPWREATFIIEALAQTLAESHEQGVVHRDVKPGNVLLTNHLQPRLADFGITLPVGMTTSGSAVAYTPSYSPPEAFAAGVAQPTIDVYSLGATLWALLAGRAPFTEAGENVDVSVVIERSTKQQLGPPSSSTPEPLGNLIARSMAKEPARRPENAGAFVAELRRAIRLSESYAGGNGNRPRSRRDLLISSVLVALIVAGLILAVGGLGWLLFR